MRELDGKRIAVLAGGRSAEREISLISGRAVLDALSSIGIRALWLDAADDFVPVLKKEKIEFVFLALHGSFGEDGTVQRLLDQEGIAYSGSEAVASANAFDKSLTQNILKKAQVRIPDFFVLGKDQPLPSADRRTWPLVVKPACCGSSIGLSIVPDARGLEAACRQAREYSDTLVIEQYIAGRELTVSILGEEALPIVEVIPEGKFYDYEAKYKKPTTRYECPAVLGPQEAASVTQIAWQAFKALGCEVMGRVDIILDKNGVPYVLEVNTIPGLTPRSLLPKAAKAKGIEFPALCVRIIELSMSRVRS